MGVLDDVVPEIQQPIVVRPDIQHRLVTQTANALSGPSVLMEDTSYIMEDTVAQMGGPTTPLAEMPLMIASQRVDGQ